MPILYKNVLTIIKKELHRILLYLMFIVLGNSLIGSCLSCSA